MKTQMVRVVIVLSAVLAATLAPGRHCLAAAPSGKSSLHKTLKSFPAKIAWECYVDGNWEIFVMNADGSHPRNLTNTPDQNEHFPRISPDGTKIAYTSDTGE